MKTKKLTALFLSVTALFLFSGCQPTTEETEGYGETTVLGVHFTQPPASVVSLSPAATEMLVNLGLTEKLSGITDACTLPEGTDVPSIGSGTDPDFDAILAVKPDLIVSQRSLSKADLEKLNQAGVKALVVPAAEDLRELESYYAALAVAFYGTDEGIAKADETLKPFYNVANALMETLNEEELATFVCFLQFDQSTATNDTFAGDVLSYLGTNVAAGTDYQTDVGQIKEANPAYIFLSKPYELANLQADESWASLAAVQNEQVISFDPSPFELRSLSVSDFLLETAKTIYPEKAGAIDAAVEKAQKADESDSSSDLGTSETGSPSSSTAGDK